MYTLKIQYPAHTTDIVKETRTAALCVQLYAQHSLESYQSSNTTLEFESDSARSFAALVLCGLDFELL